MVTPRDLPDLPDEVTGRLFFGGIRPGRRRLAAVAHEALHRREADRRLIMMDPNIRPGFIRDENDPYRARLASMMAGSDIVKLSDEDMGWLFPGCLGRRGWESDSFDSGGAARHTMGLLVTRGATGATCRLRDGKTDRPCRANRQSGGYGRCRRHLQCGLPCWPWPRRGALSRSALADLPHERGGGLPGARRHPPPSVTASRRGADSPWAHELEATAPSTG